MNDNIINILFSISCIVMIVIFVYNIMRYTFPKYTGIIFYIVLIILSIISSHIVSYLMEKNINESLFLF